MATQFARTPLRTAEADGRGYDIDAVRAEFPALSIADHGQPRRYFDAPGGTQVCRRAISAMVAHLESGTANSGGAFATSVATDAMSDAAHAAVADLFGGAAHEIAFGQNMTSLTFSVSRALGRRVFANDEIVLSRLDHDANVAPWLLLARDKGLTVRWLDIKPDEGRLDLDSLANLLGPRTKVVAVGAASNALGTVNDIPRIAEIVRARSNALLYVDAVQFVPHLITDVAAMGADFVVASPYKFFGPHQGVLWGRGALLAELEAYKVRPAADTPAGHKFETGTPSFEGQAGTAGAVEHLEWIGRTMGDAAHADRRAAVAAGMTAIAAYETELAARLLDGLHANPKVTLYGPPTLDNRVPTFGFTLAGHHPDAVAEALAARGIFAWSGNFYAKEPVTRLGLDASGGLVRVGLAHYNTIDEVEALLDALGEL